MHKPTCFAWLAAKAILNTPLGDSELICGLHWWAMKRFPRLFERAA